MGIMVILKGGPADGMRVSIDPDGAGEYLFVDNVRTADQYKGGIAMLACPKCNTHCVHALANWTFASTASPSESVDPEAGIIATVRTYPRTGQPWLYVYRRLRDYDREPVLYGYVERAEYPFTAYAHARDCTCSYCHDAREQWVTEVTNQIVAVAAQLDMGDRIPDIDRLEEKYGLDYWAADSVLGRLSYGGVMHQGRVLPKVYWRGTVETVPGSSVHYQRLATQEDIEMARQHQHSRGYWWDDSIGAWLRVADQLPAALAAVGEEPAPGVRTRG